jgi:SNF family Na+-dependent transporter
MPRGIRRGVSVDEGGSLASYTESGTRSRRAAGIVAAVYFVLAIGGLIGTWYFNFAFAAEASDLTYIEAWFVNAASSSAAVDIIVTALAANVFFVREGLRLGWGKWSWVFIPLTYLVALAFVFPLFLGLRELRLARRAPASTPQV